jgi:diacylglycerol O-acyltransferase
MKQLSPTDALFLALEKGNQRAHVGSLGIYDPSTAPGGKVRFKSILDFFTQRALVSPVFHRRLVRVPLGLDRPYWIQDGDIDVEYHVRHIALPHPGDWRQLMIQIARLHSRPLDLTKPAWEAYVIEGLDNIGGVLPGSFALYMKFHHSLIDGQAGAALTHAMHTTTVEFTAPSKPRVTLVDREPSPIELMVRMAGNRVADARKVMTKVPTLVTAAGSQLVDRLTTSAPSSEEPDDGTSKKAPQTRFGGKLSPHRVIEAMPVPLSDIAAVRKAVPGTTVNDVFLSICAGAIRRYLQYKEELPKTSLNGIMPISTRTADQGPDAGNQILNVSVPLFSNIATAEARLNSLRGRATKTKTEATSNTAQVVNSLLEVLPANLLAKVSSRLLLPTSNMTVSNVRGPDTPLYLAGASLKVFIPINVLLDGLGLAVTGFSYNGQLWIGIIADRAMMPDPGFFAQCYQDSIDEHLALAKKGAVSQSAAKHAEVAVPRKITRRRAAVKSAAKAKVSRPAK